MPINDSPALHAELEALQAKAADLATQIKAAVRREADLQQQLEASQEELAKIPFLQLGKKMLVRAEQDSINKKLKANQQLQATLNTRLEKVQKQLEELAERLEQAAAEPAAVEAPVAPAELVEAEPIIEDAPAAVEAPVGPAEPIVEDIPVVPAETVVAETPVIATEPAVEEAPVAPAPAAPAKPAKPDKPRRSTAPRKPRTIKAPRPVAAAGAVLTAEEQISAFLARLEPFYPEHKVFALESIHVDLRNQLTQLASSNGFDSPAAFLQAQGWALISNAEGKAMRQGQYCVPGQEPEAIRPRIHNVLTRLEKHYPDRVISRSIQHDHKSLAQDVSGLYHWLGYPSVADMLTAYGFHYNVPSGGRPATDAQQLLAQLQPAGADKPRTIAQLIAAHPDLASAIKTLQNQAPSRFGMPLRQYLAQQGILAGKRTEE